MQNLEWKWDYEVLTGLRFAEGPWSDEPDKKQWSDPETGLPCLIVRNNLGALCGYVGVPSQHPYYGISGEDLELDVHGGITFTRKCNESADPSVGICHLVEPGEDDNVWWIGFDCCHCNDLTPSILSVREKLPRITFLDETYKNIEFVEAEVTRLAQQLATLR